MLGALTIALPLPRFPAFRKSRSRLAIIAVALLSWGCASVPHASRENDAEAKQFNAHPGAAAIYVYRDDFVAGAAEMQDTTLYLDGRVIGMTLSRGFFRINARPGIRVLHGFSFDQGNLKLEVRSGETYFVSMKVANGNSRFALVDPQTGKRDITRCCVLLENWTPGQRPLLY
jgi:hypothetical protein